MACTTGIGESCTGCRRGAGGGLEIGRLTFDPHPAKLVAPASAPRLLTTLEERARIILEQGIDEILILPFTPEIAALGPEDFVREILVDKLKARAVLVGANFHFGKRAAGDAATLEELGDRYSFETDIIRRWSGASA